MERISAIIVAVLLLSMPVFSDASAQGLSNNHNFLRETSILKPGVKDTVSVNALSCAEAARTITYYDGLGFPIQTISVAAVPGGQHDFVQHRKYDSYMRESRAFLPYASQSASTAGFRDNAVEETIVFYGSPQLSGMAVDSAPYSVTVYDNSCLDRVLEQGAPGMAWQPSGERTDTSGRTVVTDYGTCTASGPESVRIWDVTPSGLSSSGNGADSLFSSYSYNIRSWLTSISGDIFSENMYYNYLNLPESMTFVTESGARTSRYLYNADGAKLRTSSFGPSDELTTDYSSNVIYSNGSVDRIMFDGGYIKDGEYYFFLTDYLGCVRAVADVKGNVLERYNYYPYGKDLADDFVGIQPYRFNGKESYMFAGLPLLDYGARLYNPSQTRWMTPDPLAEKYYSVSPYAFCAGNPVNLVDFNHPRMTIRIDDSRIA